MTLINSENSLVLIVDVQEKLLNCAFNKETLENKAVILTKTADILEIPTIVTEQYPKGLGGTVESVKCALSENSQVFEKFSFSALDTNEIWEAVKKSGRKQIIIFGIETHICVSQTAIALRELGFEVYLVKDACGSRAEVEHLAGIDRMKDFGVQVLTNEIVLFEWLRSAKHPKFKEVQSLIK